MVRHRRHGGAAEHGVGAMVVAFLKLPLSDESKQKILWDNWVKMYGIEVR